MSWNRFWWLQAPSERVVIDDPGYDPGAWERERHKLSSRLDTPPPPPKREVTVVRSTRAMPERKR